jgi:hypothetical protein
MTVGAADFFTDCWCNGRHLGRNEGGYTPFEFDLTDALAEEPDGTRFGWIVFRVEDPMENHEQPVGKQWRWYSRVSGIWQTVYVEPRSAEYIERFEVQPDISSSTVGLRVFTRGSGDVAVEITSPDGELISASLPVAEGIANGSIQLGQVKLWDPNDPQLYRLKLTLQSQSGCVDVVHSYFGMRSLSTVPVSQSGAPAALSLNGQPIYLRGALYQSYFPDGIYTAGDVATLKNDIIFAKRAGFDFLRVHIKIDDPLLLYYADTLGIMLMTDFPNFGEGGDTPLGRRRFEAMMRQAIQRDFNHPSIIAWCLFNETWGFGGQVELVKLFDPAEGGVPRDALPPAKMANLGWESWVQQIWQLAKTLDPTRLVEDMSVVAWDHLQQYGHGDTDINSWHFYIDRYDQAREHIERVVERSYAGSDFNFVPGFEQGTQPLINSEYGGVGALDGDVDISWSFKFLTSELRRHDKLSAYIFTELHDVEWEMNGFLNYDRTPKEFGYDPAIINHGDVLPIDAPPIQQCSPGDLVEIDIYSSHFSRRERQGVTLHWRMSGIDSVGWVHETVASGSQVITFRHHRVEVAHRVRLRMPQETMLCTLWVWASTADGSRVASNFVQFYVRAENQHASPGRQFIRAEPFSWSAAEWTGAASTREEAQSLDSCHGFGSGYFEWALPVTAEQLHHATRLRVICEASSRREGTPQTDCMQHPTTFRMLLNGVRIYQASLPNHPHDARGSLTYLRGGRGAYGYLAHATIEGVLLQEVRAYAEEHVLRLRCAVPTDGQHQGGLTIYGGAAGRYPVQPTVVIET